ncbi:MAG: hypothetical protein DRP66_00165 [Planctomycetota bacterium]|nr:MAG: hypothetical protein DRP66_00165 [Planctomycetota bacterium]
MSLKIAVIAYSCRSGGGLIQTINLFKALKDVSQNERYLLICPANCGYEDVEFPSRSDLFLYPGPHTLSPRLKFEYIKLPKIIKDYAPDVVFSPANVGLAKPTAPQVLYIRNAYFFYDKKHYPNMYFKMRLRLMMLRYQMKQFVRTSSWIFCQTPVVKKHFCQKYSYPEDKVTVLGFPPPMEISTSKKMKTPMVIERSRNSFHVLVLTRYMPHRNPHVLLPLCKKYATQLRENKIKFITTVNPQDNKPSQKFLRDINTGDIRDLIVNVGQLSREEVAAYLQAADLLWMPTLLECLPTPYLEAMIAGLPILAPDLDFSQYVCNDAAVYYNPWDMDSIYNELINIRKKEKLRNHLIAQGLKQLKKTEKFPADWNVVARDILRVLHQVADK